MKEKLMALIANLPERYQPIFNHPPALHDAVRECSHRLQIIESIYNQLSAQLGRPLRVLDLGCAQGFFSLSLATKGATVLGVDFLAQNILVCHELAQEYPELSITFKQENIVETIKNLNKNEFDLVLGLSVFHHLVHQHSIAKAQKWIQKVVESTSAGLFELAIQEEPLYWAAAQPNNPRDLFKYCHFSHLITYFSTHLSEVKRPLFVVSNNYIFLDDFCEPFSKWQNKPYKRTGSAHENSRHYYFGSNYLCKIIYSHAACNELSYQTEKRNQRELQQEINFLSSPPPDFITPTLLNLGTNKQEKWLIRSLFEGELLSDLLNANQVIDKDFIIESVLQQLVLLEQEGLYHDDLRTWNILVNKAGYAHLIDYGSISNSSTDCDWPSNLYHSFFVLVSEIVNPPYGQLNILRPFAISPFNLPYPYNRWLGAAWPIDLKQLTFKILLNLFHQRQHLEKPDLTNIEQWIVPIEQGMQRLQHYYHYKEQLDEARFAELNLRFTELQSQFENRLLFKINIFYSQLCQLIKDKAGIVLKHNFKTIPRHIGKKVISRVYHWVTCRPTLKKHVLRIVRLSGCTKYLLAINRRFSLLDNPALTDRKLSNDHLQRQIKDINKLPEQVRAIYKQITIKE